MWGGCGNHGGGHVSDVLASKIKHDTRFFIRNLAQGLVPNAPCFWTSNSQTVVLKVP